MKQTTIERIVYNTTYNRCNTIIGRYTYRMHPWSGAILRCKTDDVGRMWIAPDGRQFDAWEVVARA